METSSLSKRICVLTAGHLSTCPRMLNAADALSNAGHAVRVVSARYQDWAWHADQEVRRSRSWDWMVVNYQRCSAVRAYAQTAARLRLARFAAKALSPARSPLWLAARAYSRAHSELLHAVLSEPADLIYAGTSGALACAAVSAEKMRVPYALDLEDFHSSENRDTPDGRVTNALARRIELRVLGGAAFLTGGSAAIAEAYKLTYGTEVIPRHNVFPLPKAAPDLTPSGGNGLRIYWFGQTIGAGRGLETVVGAMGHAKIAGELHLRGQAFPAYVRELQLLAAQTAPNLSIFVHEPAPPDVMVDLCRAYDVGLATEPGCNTNNDLALSNKALTYVLAGVPVVITDTAGQHAFARDLGEGAIVFRPGDTVQLAAGLKRWSEDKSLLARAKTAAWDAAKRRWHWEHEEERGALLRAVARVFQS